MVFSICQTSPQEPKRGEMWSPVGSAPDPFFSRVLLFAWPLSANYAAFKL